MAIVHGFALFMILLGIPFFISGTIGLLRLPDIYTRLHALTKADNLGLGLIILGLILEAKDLATIARLLFIWFLVLTASSASCHLIANTALKNKITPWKRP
ncbi:MAG: monovalent cation/H(+) antiporter subunit G [Proteobacteria bacterium]|nr:monovalent cation/H(+) antiporter subunit G [Pseudomonadota bacterium]MBU1686922.1 monovalent cation/H(+) antiporter subunit G [Pseudomonadota bacterium]